MSAVALTVLAVGVMLVLIMLAARTGPQRIVHGSLHDPNFLQPGTQSLSVNPIPSPHPGHGHSFLQSSPVLTAIGWVIRVGAVLIVAWLLYRGVRRLRDVVHWRRRPQPKAVNVEFDVLDDPEPLADEIRSDAALQLELLMGGTPRNAIVACWDRFEEQAERVHVARRPWETSSEFTMRLLDAVAADSAAVARLERLYHEARFSAHEIDESRRESAVEALQAIHASLGIRVGAT